MFCLKCGRSTGTDAEFCRDHADDPYTGQTVQDELDQPKHKAEFMRCPRCNEEIFADYVQCPACQFDLTPRTA